LWQPHLLSAILAQPLLAHPFARSTAQLYTAGNASRLNIPSVTSPARSGGKIETGLHHNMTRPERPMLKFLRNLMRLDFWFGIPVLTQCSHCKLNNFVLLDELHEHDPPRCQCSHCNLEYEVSSDEIEAAITSFCGWVRLY
jgi:hypothetical protein